MKCEIRVKCSLIQVKVLDKSAYQLKQLDLSLLNSRSLHVSIQIQIRNATSARRNDPKTLFCHLKITEQFLKRMISSIINRPLTSICQLSSTKLKNCPKSTKTSSLHQKSKRNIHGLFNCLIQTLQVFCQIDFILYEQFSFQLSNNMLIFFFKICQYNIGRNKYLFQILYIRLLLKKGNYSNFQHQRFFIIIYFLLLYHKDMITDIKKQSDARIQSLGLKFTFTHEADKLIITSFCSKDNMQYLGEMVAHPYIDFDDIKEALTEGQFKTLTKTEQILKIKIGATSIELIPKLKSSINEITELKDSITNYLEKQEEMQLVINSQKKKIDEHGLLISDLKAAVEKLKLTPRISITMMEELKSDLAGKLNEVRENMKSETSAIKATINQKQKSIVEQEKKIGDLYFEMSGVQKEFQLIKNIRNEISELKLQCKNLREFAVKQVSDLKPLINNQSVVIKEMKTSLSKEINDSKVIVSSHETKLKEFANVEGRINSFHQELKKLQTGLKQNISKNDKVEEPEKIIALEKWRWSQKLKSDFISINNNTVTLTKKTNYHEFCLLDVGFSKTLKNKQSWAIKIKKITVFIGLGICLKNKIQNNNFNGKNKKWKETGHGCYLIGSSGGCYSHSQKEFNRVNKSFKFGVNDVILVEYDPIDMRLRFSLNSKQSFEMPIIVPPQDDEYHPCALLGGQNDSIELILSITTVK